jgi:tetratricopeptide (TPR) repeat protein
MQRVTRVLGDPASRAHPRAREAALEAAGGLSYWLGDVAATQASYEESLALARSNGDPVRISNALYNISFMPVLAPRDGSFAERVEAANAQIDEALALARQVGDRAAIARCLWSRANLLAYAVKDAAGALVPIAEAIPMFREVGDHFGLAWAVRGEGLARLSIGDLGAARTALDEAVALLGEARDTSGVAIALADQAELAIAEGDRSRAVRLSGASAALRHLTGAELVAKVDDIQGRAMEMTPADEAPWKEGLAMTFDQAVAYALRR